MKASDFFSRDQQEQIKSAIEQAETDTSGEIRVHIETSCNEDVLDRAAWIFKQLGMHKTADRNGVLFYLAVKDRKFAIIGDGGINSKVPVGFWDSVKETLQRNFVKGLFAEGLSEGIILAGRQLRTHFPYRMDDVNELSDEISFDTPGESGKNEK